MSYPPGFLFPPSVSLALPSCASFGSGLLLGTRTDELGRASAGSAFAPYAAPASSPGFTSHLPYGGERAAAAAAARGTNFTAAGYDAPSAISGSLDYAPFGALGPFPYGDAAYRKNATRDATATLKAWLNEHRKNPYPTKGEKIMLAIVTKMTLTQVSTWFANARRRLKKENKMTWTPRNRSEDEDEDDGGEQDEEPQRDAAPPHLISEGTSCVMIGRTVVAPGDTSDRDIKDWGEKGPPLLAGSASSEPPLRVAEADHPASKALASSGSDPAPKPKLWSLAEMATSRDRSKACGRPPASPPAPQRPAPPSSTPQNTLPHGAALPRHLYYPSPFVPGYTNYGPLGPLHGGPASSLASHLDGLHQTLLRRAEAAARDCDPRGQTQAPPTL